MDQFTLSPANTAGETQPVNIIMVWPINMQWPVIPISKFQQLDMHQEDLLNNDHFRKCDIIRAKKGQDKLHEITKKRFGKNFSNQFVVQLKGCPLKCWYCYVTPDGINNNPVYYSSEQLIEYFLKSNCDTFHLMGGAPALYYEHWQDLIKLLPEKYLFHSDFLCIEKEYNLNILKRLSKFKNAIYSISIKGCSPKEFFNNTKTKLDYNLFKENLIKIAKSGLNHYVVFTNPQNRTDLNLTIRWLHILGINMNNWFIINPVEYKAIEEYNHSCATNKKM